MRLVTAGAIAAAVDGLGGTGLQRGVALSQG